MSTFEEQVEPDFHLQLAVFLEEEWCQIHLQTLQGLYESISRRLAVVLTTKTAQCLIKEGHV